MVTEGGDSEGLKNVLGLVRDVRGVYFRIKKGGNEWLLQEEIF